MHPTRWLPHVRALCSLALVLALSFGGALPPNASAQPSAVAAITPAAAVDAAQQARTVQEAFDLINARFVHPVSSASLLHAAWEQMAKDAVEKNAPSPGPEPSFSGDGNADIAAFRTELTNYLNASPEASFGDWVAAHSAVRGMAQLVNEGHTYFLNPKQYQEHLSWTRGDVRYGGIGARMKSDPQLTVTEVFRNSPAEAAGLRAGDVVLRVDQTDIAGMALEQTISLVRGPEGTSVTLFVRKPDGSTTTYSIVRRVIVLEFVTSRLLSDNVGYVALRGFPDTRTAEQFEQAVNSLQEQGARALVLDLRGNSGGRLDVGNRLLNHFVPAGTRLYQQSDRSGRTLTRTARPSTHYDLPVAILVDSGTASMGEIFASAVQESGGASVLGSTTSGSVAAAQVYPLGDGSALQLTVMEILSGSGKTLNKVGVVPDEVITGENAAPDEDPVLDRAQELMRHAVSGTPVATYGLLSPQLPLPFPY